MALNFPADTTQPYIDPTSGLKYVYNTSVGAWESAVQPPAIIGSYPPNINIPGFLYWDKEECQLYIYYTDGDSSQWVQAVAQPEVPRSFVSSTPPSNPVEGDMWWDSADGRLFIYYVDGDGDAQWVDAAPAAIVSSEPPASISTGAPANPLPGDLWWNAENGNLYVYYSDGDGGQQWVITNSNLGIQESGLITSVSAALPLFTTGSLESPIININTATTTTTGVVRRATQSEVNTGTEATTYLTPASLKSGIGNYVTTATASSEGVMELATQSEVDAGTETDKAVTPATLANSSLLNVVPTGTVVMWATSSIPTGWLECNGQATTAYPDLAAVVGANVPDLRGEFVRGYDNGRGIDAGRSLGSFQASDIAPHTHDFLVTANAAAGTGIAQSDSGGSQLFTTNSTGTTDTRPRNISLMYIIKT